MLSIGSVSGRISPSENIQLNLGSASSVMYITDRASRGAHNPNLTLPACGLCRPRGARFLLSEDTRDVASRSQ
jgi:hypothetical protein